MKQFTQLEAELSESKKVVSSKNAMLKEAHTMVNGLNNDKANLMEKVKVCAATIGFARDELNRRIY